MKPLMPHSSANQDFLDYTPFFNLQVLLDLTDDSNLVLESHHFRFGHPSNKVIGVIIELMAVCYSPDVFP